LAVLDGDLFRTLDALGAVLPEQLDERLPRPQSRECTRAT
jgi:hypothetical protein